MTEEEKNKKEGKKSAQEILAAELASGRKVSEFAADLRELLRIADPEFIRAENWWKIRQHEDDNRWEVMKLEAQQKAKIYGADHFIRLEEFFDMHTPRHLEDRRVTVRWPGRDAEILEGVVTAMDPGYVEIRQDNGARFVVSWSSGPVFQYELEPKEEKEAPASS